MAEQGDRGNRGGRDQHDKKQQKGGGGSPNRALLDSAIFLDGSRHKLTVVVVDTASEGKELTLYGGSKEIPWSAGALPETVYDPTGDQEKPLTAHIQNGHRTLQYLDLLEGFEGLTHICFRRMEKGKLLTVKAELPPADDAAKELAKKDIKKSVLLEVKRSEKNRGKWFDYTIYTKTANGKPEATTQVEIVCAEPVTVVDTITQSVLANKVRSCTFQTNDNGKRCVSIHIPRPRVMVTFSRTNPYEEVVVEQQYVI